MSSPPREDRVDSVPLIPLSGGPFSVQLLLSPAPGGSDAGPDPFHTLSEEDEHTRVFLGAVMGNAESVVDFCSVKLVKNVFPPAGILEAAAQTNVSIEERLRTEAERVRSLAAVARFAPRLWEPASRDGEEAGRVPPLLFCVAGHRLFSPPCPRCAGPLELCRDDSVLSRAGLPTWSGSLERFLSCPKCLEEDAEAPFYAFESGEVKGQVPVLSFADLAQQLGEALTGGAETEHIRAAFPCPECVEAAAAFKNAIASGSRPAPFWEGRWWPLAFYGSACVVTGFGDVGLEEFADLLGGRPLERQAGEKPLPPGLASLARAPHPGAGAATGRFFFEGSSAGLDAVEVFALKLAAFRQVLEAVLSYYRVLGRPHLDIHPRHIFVDLSRPGDALPFFWSFQVRLHGLSSAARVERLKGAGDVVVPPRSPSVPYAPPEVLEFHLTPPRPAQVVLTEIEEVAAKGGDKTWRFHGKLTDPYGIYPSPRDHDWILVSIDNESLGMPATLPCRRDPRSKPDLQELVFISEPVSLEAVNAQRLKKAIGARIPGVRYKIYSDFSAPSDLFSLGMILLRLLVGNDKQDGRAVATAVDRVVKKLSSAGQSTLAGYVRGGPAVASLLEKDPEIFGAFKKSNVFYQAIDRSNERPNAIPDFLWKRALLLALRLTTRVEDFSLCESPADYDSAHPTAKLEQVANDVDLLQQELRALLFDRQAPNLEILQVLSEIGIDKTAAERSSR